MSIKNIERDSETIIDYKLKNLAWNDHPSDNNRTVWKQGVKTSEQKKKLEGLVPIIRFTPEVQMIR